MWPLTQPSTRSNARPDTERFGRAPCRRLVSLSGGIGDVAPKSPVDPTRPFGVSARGASPTRGLRIVVAGFPAPAYVAPPACPRAFRPRTQSRTERLQRLRGP